MKTERALGIAVQVLVALGLLGVYAWLYRQRKRTSRWCLGALAVGSTLLAAVLIYIAYMTKVAPTSSSDDGGGDTEPLTPLYKPLIPLYKPLIPLYKPLVPLFRPLTPLYKPLTPIYKPLTPIYKPLTPIYKYLTPLFRPLVPLNPAEHEEDSGGKKTLIIVAVVVSLLGVGLLIVVGMRKLRGGLDLGYLTGEQIRQGRRAPDFGAVRGSGFQEIDFSGVDVQDEDERDSPLIP
jgi:hypothetical protein